MQRNQSDLTFTVKINNAGDYYTYQLIPRKEKNEGKGTPYSKQLALVYFSQDKNNNDPTAERMIDKSKLEIKYIDSADEILKNVFRSNIDSDRAAYVYLCEDGINWQIAYKRITFSTNQSRLNAPNSSTGAFNIIDKCKLLDDGRVVLRDPPPPGSFRRFKKEDFINTSICIGVKENQYKEYYSIYILKEPQQIDNFEDNLNPDFLEKEKTKKREGNLINLRGFTKNKKDNFTQYHPVNLSTINYASPEIQPQRQIVEPPSFIKNVPVLLNKLRNQINTTFQLAPLLQNQVPNAHPFFNPGNFDYVKSTTYTRTRETINVARLGFPGDFPGTGFSQKNPPPKTIQYEQQIVEQPISPQPQLFIDNRSVSNQSITHNLPFCLEGNINPNFLEDEYNYIDPIIPNEMPEDELLDYPHQLENPVSNTNTNTNTSTNNKKRKNRPANLGEFGSAWTQYQSTGTDIIVNPIENNKHKTIWTQYQPSNNGSMFFCNSASSSYVQPEKPGTGNKNNKHS